MITRFKKTPRGEWLYHLKFKNVSKSANRVRPFQRFKKQFGQDAFFNKLSFPQKVYGITGAALFGIVTNPHLIMTVFGKLSNYFEDAADGRGNIYTRNLRENIKEKGRENSIGIGVGQGLAWLHYADYLRHVLPVMKDKIEQSKWYNELSDEEKKRMPMKLYELIPRKCYVDITGIDDKIQHEEEIIIDSKIPVKIQIYSIMEGQTKYYCMCKCPNELKTMNTVNDIQMAGISRSKFSFAFPWNRKSTVQMFTIDTKLVQLMRFYYTLSSLLQTDKTWEWEVCHRARLLLFNESDKKLSTVLLKEIQEDLKLDTSSKAEECNNDNDGQFSNLEVEFRNRPALLKYSTIHQITEDDDKLESDKKASNSLSQNKKKDSKVVNSSQKTHNSLMEKTLLTAEENKDVVYEYDVFVTCGKDAYDEEKCKSVSHEAVEVINNQLIAKNMKILFEKDCIGNDWLLKLKYAATKCRWIVILDTKIKEINEIKLERKQQVIFPILQLLEDFLPDIAILPFHYILTVPKLVVSHQVTDSLKGILKSRKVQTVAIVNQQNELHVLDDLKCVTCIPLIENSTRHIETLYKVVSGSEIKLERSQELCSIQGDVAVGLAWHYAAYHLNEILPGAIQTNDGIMNPLRHKKTLIVLPHFESGSNWIEFSACKEYLDFKEEMKYKDGIEFPRPLELLVQMEKDNVLSRIQVHSEVRIFYQTVNKIMEILMPDKIEDYEFFFHKVSGENQTTLALLKKRLNIRYVEEQLRLPYEQQCTDNSPF